MKLLSKHPDVELGCVTSRSLAGTNVADNMPALRHLLPENFKFISSSPEEQAKMDDIDIWFLALPHGAAAEYARALVNAGKTVLDLSADFRLNSLDIYRNITAPTILHRALQMGKYVIPELFPYRQTTSL
ncbi:MAG: hypothetical protein ACLUKN_01910 [Bacilli bacterium]